MMTTFVWDRGIQESGAGSGPAAFRWVPLSYWASTSGPLTLRRVLVQWHFQMEESTGSWPLVTSVPGAYALALTTAVDPAAPAAPTVGPFSQMNPASYDWWFWQGLDWKIEYIAVTGNSLFGNTGLIDYEVNRTLPATLNKQLWLGFEQDDDNGSGGSYFTEWVFSAYYQTLVSAP